MRFCELVLDKTGGGYFSRGVINARGGGPVRI